MRVRGQVGLSVDGAVNFTAATAPTYSFVDSRTVRGYDFAADTGLGAEVAGLVVNRGLAPGYVLCIGFQINNLSTFDHLWATQGTHRIAVAAGMVVEVGMASAEDTTLALAADTPYWFTFKTAGGTPTAAYTATLRNLNDNTLQSDTGTLTTNSDIARQVTIGADSAQANNFDGIVWYVEFAGSMNHRWNFNTNAETTTLVDSGATGGGDMTIIGTPVGASWTTVTY
jgi:hypothetical protein